MQSLFQYLRSLDVFPKKSPIRRQGGWISHLVLLGTVMAGTLAGGVNAATVNQLGQASAKASGAGVGGNPSVSSFNIPAGKNRVLFIWIAFERDHCSITDLCTAASNPTGVGLGDNWPQGAYSATPQLTARVVGAASTINKKNALTVGGTPSGDLRFHLGHGYPGTAIGNPYMSLSTFHIALYENEINQLLGGAASGTVNITLPDVSTPISAGDEAFISASVYENVEQTDVGIVRNAVPAAQSSASAAQPGNTTLTAASYDAGQAPNETADGNLVMGFSSSTEGFITPTGFTQFASQSISNNGGVFDTTSAYTTNEPNGSSFVGLFRNNNSTGAGYSLQSAATAATPLFSLLSQSFLLESDNSDTSDAPASYGSPTHTIVNGIRLGASVDADPGLLNSSNATGDDTNGTDDEDGVTLPSLTQGQSASITVNVNQVTANTGKLQGWIDWNGDGDFADAGEQIATDLSLSTGTSGNISVPITVPASAIVNTPTFARFRWSTTVGLTSVATTTDGEVEDYSVTITGPAISGTVFQDNVSGTGIVGTKDVAEPGINGVTVVLRNPTTNTCTSVSTNPSGVYTFPSVSIGTYQIIEAAGESTPTPATCSSTMMKDPTGYASTTKNILTVTVSGSNLTNQDFGDHTAASTSLNTCPAPAYITQGTSSSNITLSKVNLLTGALTSINSTAIPGGVNALGFSQVDGYIYGIEFQSNRVKRIDPVSGVSYDLGAIAGLPVPTAATNTYVIGDVSENGILYIMPQTIIGNSTIYAIDVNPTSPTYLTLLGSYPIVLNNIYDIAFHPYNGKLYTIQAASGKIFEITLPSTFGTTITPVDRTKPTALPTGSLTVPYGSLYFASDESIYAYLNGNAGSNDGGIYRITNVVGPGAPIATALTTTATGVAQNDGARCPLAPPVFPSDYGDAPANYGDASHIFPPPSTLYLGTAAPDAESSTQLGGDAGASATGDDIMGSPDDEDGITLPGLIAGATSYTIPAANITATNSSGSAATLHAWVDFNKNGTFESSEYASTPVNNGTNNGNPTAALSWSGVTVGATGNTYARFRLTTDSSVIASTPSSVASGGEVEDYRVTIAAPVPAKVLLIKRITEINGDRIKNPNDPTKPLNQVLDNPATTNDTDVNWPSGYLVGAFQPGLIKSNDYIEYTVYFLNAQGANASAVKICDRIVGEQQFVTDGYGAGQDIEYKLGTNAIQYLTKASLTAVDRAELNPSTGAIAGCPAPSITGTNNGTVTLDVTGTGSSGQVDLTTLPGATGPGVPTNSYGYFRFKVKVNP